MSDFYIKPFSFQLMAKPTGSVCNLNCTYCYYLEKRKLYQGSGDMRMSEAFLDSFIKQYISSQHVPVISFVWQGGEPSLLGLDYYKRILEIQTKYAGGKIIENSFQTNGTLIDDQWARFFKENNFLVGISIDGPEKIHNRHRPFKSKEPSFAQVMRGIELLHKYQVDFNTLTVVNRDNSRFPLEIYHFLKQIGSSYIQFIPIVERNYTGDAPHPLNLVGPEVNAASITEWSVIPEDYAHFLIRIFEEWVRNDVGNVFVQIFDATLANWVGENPGICIFSETCGDAAVIEHNGDVYSCDHYVYPEYRLGNLKDLSLLTMLQSESQKQFGLNKVNTLPHECIVCEYRFACHGECPKHRFEKTATGEPGLNYLCKAYKKFYKHVHPYMQYMGDELAAKRAPANIMNWLKSF